MHLLDKFRAFSGAPCAEYFGFWPTDGNFPSSRQTLDGIRSQIVPPSFARYQSTISEVNNFELWPSHSSSSRLDSAEPRIRGAAMRTAVSNDFTYSNNQHDPLAGARESNCALCRQVTSALLCASCRSKHKSLIIRFSTSTTISERNVL